MSHIFVMGEDRSFTREENALLAAEVETHRDILIAPSEESSTTVSEIAKHCIYWVTQHHEFDILIKTEDDSTLFLSRLVGAEGWLQGLVGRGDDFLYFGKKHALAKVRNPANFEPNEVVNTDMFFEFDYRGVYWPEYMDGGMYGISRRLADEIVKNDFRTYTSEDAMVGVWVSSFRVDTLYLADEQVLSREGEYLASNGSCVVASFHTDLLRLASMWCEYGKQGTLSSGSIMALNVQQALHCLGSYEQSALTPRSLPLGARDKHQAVTLASLKREWPIKDRPVLEETGEWWSRMGGLFHGRPAVVVGTSTTVDRLPLYLLQGIHTLVLDDFFRVSERYTSWAPTMYMCADPTLCASSGGGGGRRRGSRGAVIDVEGANRFARTVFAAFYALDGTVDGVEYWRYLRQRVDAHWFVAGEVANEEIRRAPGLSTVTGTDGGPTTTLRVLSHRSGIAMGLEVLSFLGFSPIYITAANEELAAQWEEVARATQLAAATHETKVVYLYADEDDKLPKRMVNLSPNSGGGKTASGKMSSQEEFLTWAKKNRHNHAGRSAKWDLEVFLQHFPVLSRLEVVRGASSVEAMFPRSPRCRDADDLDRFQKAVLCPVKISLKHFSSFLAWHVPYGPVRGTFVWAKR